MIIFSDLHLCEKTADTVFKEVLPGLKQAALADSDKRLVCLGDFYHIRYTVNVAIQNAVFEYLKDLSIAGIEVSILPGNHDQINEAGDNALQPFNALEWIHIFTDPTHTPFGTFIPYRKNKEDIIDFMSKGELSNSPVFMHQGIQSFEVNNGIVDSDGLDPTIFSKELIISGHYHKRQNKGNIFYVGSPYQIDAGESGQEKGYCVFKDGALFYETTDWGPKYINVGEVSEKSIIQGKPGDVVRIKAPKGVDLEVFRKGLVVPEGVKCVVEPSISDNAQRLGSDISTISDYAIAYAKEFKGNLDEQVLIQTFNQLGK